MERKRSPLLSASASVDNEGKVHISLANLNPGKADHCHLSDNR